MPLKTILLTSLGFVFLILGAIGVLLPVWPTTPFVLVSVACFSSAPQIKAQIMKIPLFREHIENHEKRNGLPQKTVMKSLIWLWVSLFISITLTHKVWLIMLLAVIGVCVSLYIVSISKAKVDKFPNQQ